MYFNSSVEVCRREPTAALAVLPSLSPPQAYRSKVTEACWHGGWAWLGLLPGSLPTSHPPPRPGLHDMRALRKRLFKCSVWGRPFTSPLPTQKASLRLGPSLQNSKRKSV